MENIISYIELCELFKRVSILAGFSEDWFASLRDSHGLPFMSTYITAQLWLEKIPETSDTEAFREHVKFLNSQGFFNVIKETKTNER
jgi:hypothetical protein